MQKSETFFANLQKSGKNGNFPDPSKRVLFCLLKHATVFKGTQE
jgi:hypothetical protein